MGQQKGEGEEDPELQIRHVKNIRYGRKSGLDFSAGDNSMNQTNLS